MTLILMTSIMVLVFGIQAFIPFLVKKTEVFGVYVPEQYTEEPRLIRLKKSYAVICLIIGVVFTGGYAAGFSVITATEAATVVWGLGFQLLLIFFSMSLYYRNHLIVKNLKKQQEWEAGKTKKAVADLQFRSELKMVPSWIFILPVIITAGLISYTFMVYEQLPEQIPTHWGADGTADAFADKTSFSSISLLLVLLFMQILFLFLNQGMRNSGAKIRASRKKQSRERELVSRKYGSLLLVVSSVGITLLFGNLQLLIIFPGLGSSVQTLVLILAFLLLTFIATGFYVYKVVKTSHSSEETPELDVLDADDDKYWKAGIFYVNKEDPSMLVEKRFGVGWTVNFGNMKSWVLVFLPLILLLLFVFLI